MTPKKTIDPNRIKTRDPLMVRIIQGATKAGAQVDRKKKANREACRRKPSREETR